MSKKKIYSVVLTLFVSRCLFSNWLFYIRFRYAPVCGEWYYHTSSTALNSIVGRVVYKMLIFSVPTQHAVFQSTAGYRWRVQKEVSWFYWWRRQNCIRGWLDKNESKSHCVCVCVLMYTTDFAEQTYSSLGRIIISRCATIEIMNILLYIYIRCQNDCCSYCCHFVSPICFYFKSLSFQ